MNQTCTFCGRQDQLQKGLCKKCQKANIPPEPPGLNESIEAELESHIEQKREERRRRY